MFFQSMTFAWLMAMVILLIVEAIVPGLVSIWFAIGALAGLIAALLKAPVWLQVALFVAVSLAALILTRPLVKEYVNSRTVKTNADAVIGKECVITQKVDNIMGTGAAKVDGKEWTARSADDAVCFEKGGRARVESIEGVKLIIRPLD